MPEVLPPSVTGAQAFAVPFDITSSGGALYIEPQSAALKTRLHLKGSNWAGFQTDGCPHILWRDATVDDYINFLVLHKFNSVRIPLNSVLINANSAVGSLCGSYSGMTTLDVLDDVLTRLLDAGIFALLDMHTSVVPEQNTGLWCGAASACNFEAEAPILLAWIKLARRYCSSHLNILGAGQLVASRSPTLLIVPLHQPIHTWPHASDLHCTDLYNEPFSATWGVGDSTNRWDLAATRLGNAVLYECPRWMIVVEGVAQHGGSWSSCSQHGGCWWGENIQGHVSHPIVLSDESKLVLSPHVCECCALTLHLQSLTPPPRTPPTAHLPTSHLPTSHSSAT